MTSLATLLAMSSAATFALSTSFQHQAAEGAPKSARGLVGLVGYLLRRPSWLLGQLLAVLGFGLHALALHFGPIALVQPIIISGIVIAVPVRAAMSRRFPSRNELRAVSMTALGLAGFLVASNPSMGTSADLGTRPLIIVAACCTLALAAGWSAHVSRLPVRSAFLLGVASGVLFGLVAGLLKLALQELADGGLTRLLTVWPTWALVVIGGAGVVTNQVAYRRARLSASMPVLNIMDGLVALGFGYIVFAEVPRHSPLLVAVQLVSLGCVAAGLFLVGRLADEPLGRAADLIRSE